MTCKVCKVGLALEVQKPVTAMRNRTDAGTAFTRKLHTAAPSVSEMLLWVLAKASRVF